MDVSLWIVPTMAFILTGAFHLIALHVFPYWKLLDFPERYNLKRKRIPYPTGILSVMVFLIFFGLLEPWSLQSTGVTLSVLILGVCAFIDDRRQLSPQVRLAVQIVIGLIIFIAGTRVYSFTNPLEQLAGFTEIIKLDQWTVPGPLGPLPILSGLFTLMWLGLTMNALNWFDGIPGQVSTLSVIGFLILGALSLSSRVNQPEYALVAFTLGGIALGSLVFDFPAPKVVMGDSGAMFFGLMLGILTIYAGGKVATAFLVLGVPLIDSAIVIARRIKKRTSLTKGNTHNEHLHHRLLKRGWTERQIIFLTALLGTTFGVSALFLSTLGKFVSAVILFLVMLTLSFYSRPSNR